MNEIPKFQLMDMQTVDRGEVQIEQKFGRLMVRSEGRSFEDITSHVGQWLESIDANNGLVTLFLRHTSASLTIQENTDPDVQLDIMDSLDIVAPKFNNWRHIQEGPDDLPSHIKSAVIGVSQSVPILNGSMELGTWQSIYLVEHREQPHVRTVCLHYIGDLL